jgi:hypothetical protein
MLASTNVDICFRRRELLKPAMDTDYKLAMCAASVPITDKLFGGNLAEQVKDITEANRVTNKVMGRGNTPRGRGNTGFGYRGQGRGPSRYRGTPYSRGGQPRMPGQQRGNSHSQNFQFGRSGDYWSNAQQNQQSKNGQGQQKKQKE